MPDVIDDAWLADLLQHRAFLLADAEIAAETAAALAAHGLRLDADGLVTRTLLDALDETWERGWQPADVTHVARRKATAGSVPLTTALIAEHARRTSAVERAPDTWVDQLREIGALGRARPGTARWWPPGSGPSGARRPRRGASRCSCSARCAAPHGSSCSCRRRRGGAPPGGGADGPATGGDDRALRVIRGLLAKAESTEFAEEAEALTAKAQELMTRHAVDAAVLQGDVPPGDVGTRRVHVADPYVRAKVQLLGAVAEANDVRLVWYQGLGIATIVGGRADLDAVELLFTSLLLQVAQGLASAEQHAGRYASPRTFRRAFLLGYAHRIGERLQDARRRATAEAAAERGLDLLPVLRSRREAVDAAVAELFPKLRTSRSRASVDAGGWFAGRSAAERADVGPRRSPLT